MTGGEREREREREGRGFHNEGTVPPMTLRGRAREQRYISLFWQECKSAAHINRSGGVDIAFQLCRRWRSTPSGGSGEEVGGGEALPDGPLASLWRVWPSSVANRAGGRGADKAGANRAEEARGDEPPWPTSVRPVPSRARSPSSLASHSPRLTHSQSDKEGTK